MHRTVSDSLPSFLSPVSFTFSSLRPRSDGVGATFNVYLAYSVDLGVSCLLVEAALAHSCRAL